MMLEKQISIYLILKKYYTMLIWYEMKISYPNEFFVTFIQNNSILIKLIIYYNFIMLNITFVNIKSILYILYNWLYAL